MLTIWRMNCQVGTSPKLLLGATSDAFSPVVTSEEGQDGHNDYEQDQYNGLRIKWSLSEKVDLPHELPAQ